MASSELATGYISLSISTRDMGKQIARGFSGADRTAGAAGKRAGKSFGGGFSGLAVAGIAGAVAAAGIAAVKGLTSSIAEAREAEKVGKTTSQIIKATGGAAKVSAADVSNLAEAISRKAGMDDEAIQKGANLLLTFKNVRNEAGKGGKVFDRATQSAVDLSAAGFGSVEGASKMLGKALNDPVKGITALQRAGVTFTDQQKEQIKTLVASGDVLGAQKIILGEVESQVGGVAAASATAGEKMSVAFGNFKEQLGTALLPLIDRFQNFMTTKALPALSKFVAFLSANMGPAVARVKTALAPVVAFIKGLFTSVSRDGAPASAFLKTQLLPALAGLVRTGQRLAAVVLPIIKQIAAEFVRSWPQIKTIVMGVFKTVSGIVLDVMAIVQQAVKIGTFLIAKLWAKNGAGIIRAVKGTFGGIVKIIGGAMKIIGGIVKLVLAVITGDKKKAAAAWKQIWSGVKNIIVGIWRVIKNTVGALVKTLLSEIMAKWRGFLSWAGSKLRAGLAKIRDYVLTPIRAARDRLKAILDQVAGKFRSAVTAIGRAWDALKAKAAAPIRFIINTVINGGLIKAFNAISKQVGGPHLNNVPSFATGGILPGYTPGRDVHKFYSPTGGRLDLSGGEPVMRPEFGRAVGKDWINKANQLARTRGVEGVRDFLKGPRQFASGGIIGRFAPGGIIPKITKVSKTVKDYVVTTVTKLVAMGATLKNALAKVNLGEGGGAFGLVGRAAATKLKLALYEKGKDWVKKVVTTTKKKIVAAVGGGGDPGGPAVGGGRNRVRWKGGTFTERFRNTLIRAQRFAGRNMPVTQGGFRPRTSYSGTSHAGDAIDTAWSAALLRGLRKARVAAWHRSPSQGPWNHHIHGVPLPGAGYGGGSAKWQAQDYLRGGNGLARGGFVQIRKFDTGGYLKPGLTIAQNSTGQREKILDPNQTRAWENGAGTTFNGPVTVADPAALIKAIEKRRREREALRPVLV